MEKIIRTAKNQISSLKMVNAQAVWRGTGWILGGAALRAPSYPVVLGSKDDATGEEVEFDIMAPVEIPGPLTTKFLRQEVQMRISVSRDRIKILADNTLSTIADMIAFASGCMVKRSLGAFTNAPPGVTTGDNHTIMPMTRVLAPGALMEIDPAFLKHIITNIDDFDSDRGRRLMRALRWLRRSYEASDEIGEFTALAFAYEALKSLLPEPPENDYPHAPEGSQDIHEDKKPDTNDKLRYWAVARAKIKPKDWRHVGRLRNELFHGGLTEDAGTQTRALEAIPFLRFALITALKELLELSAEAPPAVNILPIINLSYFMVPGVVLTKPPEAKGDLF